MHPRVLTISKPYCGYYDLLMVDFSHTHFHFVVVFGHLCSYQKSHIYVCFMYQCLYHKEYTHVYPDSKAQWANMGLTWVLSAPDGPHVGPMNLAIRVIMRKTNSRVPVPLLEVLYRGM